jgi:CheY-like chemotaxis protein
VVLAVALEGREADQMNIRFSVKDTGIGISQEDQNVIFEAFTQLNYTEESYHQGTGLGLAICKRLVEEQGGELGINSRVGEGSEFYFTLPLGVDKLENSVNESIHGAAVNPYPGMRVLVADDDEINRKYISYMLNDMQIEVVQVEDGAAALEAATNQRFDLILMDIRMPKMSGTDAIKAIRAFEKGKDWRTPILALTAHALEEERKSFFRVGVDGCLVKPVLADVLMESVENWLGSSRSGGATGEIYTQGPAMRII